VQTDWTAFGGGARDTVIGTTVLALMLLAILLAFALPRRFVLAPLIFALILLPVGETFVLGGVHLYVTRILILAGFARSLILCRSQKPLLSFGYTLIDKIFTLWAIFRSTAFVLVHQEMGAVVNQMGYLWDMLGGYFLMRLLIRDNADARRTAKWLCAIVVLLSITLIYEKFSGINPYGLIAGYPILPEIRNNSIRAQGPFHHAILAGTFGATLVPLFIWLCKSRGSRFLGFVGITASTAVTFSAASSTSVSAYVAAVLGIILWPLRRNMRLVRWGIVGGIITLAALMHAPVWFVLEHIDFAGGSSGQHRAMLIDNFIRHFSEWWLIGTKDYGQWGFLMMDTSNQYVAEGECGGIVSIVCIIAVLALNFRRIGRSRKAAHSRYSEWYFWLLGTALFCHTVAFFGISYFDQTRFAWYALLAMITAATSTATSAPDAHSILLQPQRQTVNTSSTLEALHGA
jgi:hypothetical protein